MSAEVTAGTLIITAISQNDQSSSLTIVLDECPDLWGLRLFCGSFIAILCSPYAKASALPIANRTEEHGWGTLLRILRSAPLSNNACTMAVWPSLEAHMSAVLLNYYLQHIERDRDVEECHIIHNACPIQTAQVASR
jgi:hypothetical protein